MNISRMFALESLWATVLPGGGPGSTRSEEAPAARCMAPEGCGGRF